MGILTTGSTSKVQTGVKKTSKTGERTERTGAKLSKAGAKLSKTGVRAGRQGPGGGDLVVLGPVEGEMPSPIAVGNVGYSKSP